MQESLIYLLNAGDAVTTYLFLTFTNGRELNPLVNMVIERIGLAWTMVLKIVLVVALMRLGFWGLRDYPVHTAILSWTGVIVFGSAVVWNGYNLVVELI